LKHGVPGFYTNMTSEFAQDVQLSYFFYGWSSNSGYC